MTTCAVAHDQNQNVKVWREVRLRPATTKPEASPSRRRARDRCLDTYENRIGAGDTYVIAQAARVGRLDVDLPV